MARKILVLYKADGFNEEYYVSQHLPLAARNLEGVVSSVEVGKVIGESPYCRVAILGVPDDQTEADVMANPGMQETVADLANCTQEGGFDVIVYET